MLVAVAVVVIVIVLKLRLHGIGGHGTSNTTENLAQLAAADPAAQEGAAGAAYCRGEETTVLLLAVWTHGVALPLVLMVVMLAVRVCRL